MKIKFKLIDDCEVEPQIGEVEVLLLGDDIESYLIAFKSFLIACGFSEELVSEIQTLENAYYKLEEERKNKDFS